MNYVEMSTEELKKLEAELSKQYDEYKSLNLKLDMSRGKPSPAQLDLTNGMLDVITSKTSLVTESGVDCRNYGVLEGIEEARKLMGDFLGVPAENVFDAFRSNGFKTMVQIKKSGKIPLPCSGL